MTWEVYHALTGKVAKSGFATERDAGLYAWSLSDPHMLRRRTQSAPRAKTITITPEELKLLSTYAANGAEDRENHARDYPQDYDDEQGAADVIAECERIAELCNRINSGARIANATTSNFEGEYTTKELADLYINDRIKWANYMHDLPSVLDALNIFSDVVAHLADRRDADAGLAAGTYFASR